MALGGFRIGSVRGIPIRVHFTLLLILPLLAWAFSRVFSEAARVAEVAPGELVGSPLLWGLGMAVALFFSVLLHELAHSLYALKRGGRVRDITLLMIGGVSQMTESPKESRHEAMMAFVGPLTSLVIGGSLLGLNFLLDFQLFNVRFAVFYLGALNIVLGVFNLLPAFPMDGGRILRAVLTPRMGTVRATRAAATVGKGFAIVFGILGLMSFNFILILVAFFIFMGAEGESRQVQLKASLENVSVRDVMRADPSSLPAGATVADAVEYLVRERRLSAIVEKSEGKLGIATLAALRKIPSERRDSTALIDVARDAPVLAPDDPAHVALQKLAEEKDGRIVVAENGRLVGTLSADELMRALQLRELEKQREKRRPPTWGHREQEA